VSSPACRRLCAQALNEIGEVNQAPGIKVPRRRSRKRNGLRFGPIRPIASRSEEPTARVAQSQRDYTCYAVGAENLKGLTSKRVEGVADFCPTPMLI
jgi:hypothetical protein